MGIFYDAVVKMRETSRPLKLTKSDMVNPISEKVKPEIQKEEQAEKPVVKTAKKAVVKNDTDTSTKP